MANHNFYMNFPQSTCSTPTPTTTSGAIWSSYQSNTGSCWPTPYTAPGELEANLKTENVSTSERNATIVNDSSDTKTTASDVTTTTAADTSATTPAADSEGKNTEVKIPKNAVELIVAAITACHTTTPTLTEIATHIHSTAAAYRDHELSTLVKMVQHHLHNNNPGFFLPVMSTAGHTFNNPNMARWAINLQAVVVGEDGSVTKRRHRSHAYKSCSTPSPNRPAPRGFPPLYMSPPDGASGTCSPHLFQMYSSTPTGYSSTPTGYSSTPTGYSNAASPYYSTAAFLPGGTTMTNGTTMNMFGTTTCSFSAGQPPMGTGMYGVPLSRGNVGKMPTARSQNSVAYPYPM